MLSSFTQAVAHPVVIWTGWLAIALRMLSGRSTWHCQRLRVHCMYLGTQSEPHQEEEQENIIISTVTSLAPYLIEVDC